MKNNIVKTITRNAIVAAIYFLLTFISPISFGGIQLRLAEVLVLLCFFQRDFIFGCTIGCLLANLFSPLMPWDLLFGTLGTLLSCLAISFCKHLFIATLFPVLVNAFIVGGELAIIMGEPLLINVGMIAAGEFIAVSLLGYGLFWLLKNNKTFFASISATKNINFKW